MVDPSAYVVLARDECDDLRRLADDIAQALVREDRRSFSLWSEWESEGYGSYEVHSIQPERYPLAFFCLRLLELVTESTPTLNLQGHAKTMRDWFEALSERFERYVSLPPDKSIEGQRELAVSALHDAVRRDEEADPR